MTRYDYGYEPGRIYPMKRRKWPIWVGLLVSAAIVFTCAFAYHVTTGEPAFPSPTTTATKPPATGDVK